MAEGVETIIKDFDILSWWKTKTSTYRVLGAITRDILAIHVTTVASESAFNSGGRILDHFRSSLTPKLVESLICAQDWLRSTSSSVEIEEKLEMLEEFEIV